MFAYVGKFIQLFYQLIQMIIITKADALLLFISYFPLVFACSIYQLNNLVEKSDMGNMRLRLGRLAHS